jgi:hypothetical protein
MTNRVPEEGAHDHVEGPCTVLVEHGVETAARRAQ